MEDKKVITVPDGWHEVPINKYQEIHDIVTNNDIKDADKFIEIASILIDEDPENIKSYNIETFLTFARLLDWTNESPSDAIYKPIIKIDDVEYGLIDRLTKLTVGEWMDLEHYIESPILNMHIIFAILYRPLLVAYNDRDRIIENYDANELERRAEIFKSKMMIADVYGALVFFCRIAQNYMKITLEYSDHTNKIMKMLKENIEMVKEMLKD